MRHLVFRGVVLQGDVDRLRDLHFLRQFLQHASEIPEHVAGRKSQIAFGVCHRCDGEAEQVQPIDALTITDALKRASDLDAVGGPAYVMSLTDGVPRASNIVGYADLVQRSYDLRRVIQTGSHLLQRAHEADAEPAAVVDEAERLLSELSHDRALRTDGLVPATELVTQAWGYLEQLTNRKGGLTGLETGWADIDAQTRGWQPGHLILVAGRPSMGKTALGLQTAFHAAKAGKRVGLFSLEMTKEELLLRLISQEGRIDGHRLQSGYAGERDMARMSQALASIHESFLSIDDTPSLSTLELRRRARRHHRTHGLDLIVIDYLQLMRGDRRAENRQQEVSSISRDLKALAKELKIPVIALCQLSRGPEARIEGRPQLSDLRESGSLEQDSDIVILMYRGEYYRPEDVALRGRSEAIIAKNRSGPVGTVPLTWQKEYTRFDDITARAA